MNRLLTPLLALAATVAAAEDPYEQAPIFYSQSQPNDPAQKLERLLHSGQAKVDRSDAWAVLRDLMRHLDIPEESQVMVFSKTSKQNDLIHPQTPRAVFFGDEAYVGYCLGGEIEVAAIDPRLGPVFYLLNPDLPARQPLHFQRDQSCLSCHGGIFSPGVPGVLVRSVFPGPQGHPIMSQGSTVVDSTTPFESRWGGWYVTGRHGDALHRGNVTAVELPGNRCDLPVDKGANLTSLTSLFDTTPYPRPTSDIVALMVLEHQTGVQNVLTRANHSAMRAMHMQISLQRELGEPVQTEPVGTARRIIDHSAEAVLDALLFKDEASLPEGGIEGDGAFEAAFARKARRSSDGRSLRDFQLHTRLFKYRCSYMIHSQTFTHLEPSLKKTVLDRLAAVLDGRDTSDRYTYLGDSERRHIRAILGDLLPPG
jgi:hypothetical protein